MGLLSVGTPLDWQSAEKHIQHVKDHGIEQFLNIWSRVKGRRLDNLIWGDELEYIVVKLRDGKAMLNLEAQEKLESLENDPNSTWHPEYGRYMLEGMQHLNNVLGTPKFPYGCRLLDLLAVEDNMIHRRKVVSSVLDSDDILLSLTNFPRLGCEATFYPDCAVTPYSGVSRSLFISDNAINSHARFPTLTANIRTRRGSKVAINVPIYKDKLTPTPFLETIPKSINDSDPSTTLPNYEEDAKADHIYMDCMCFGMGCCCLQVTFQACSVEEARRLYDQLATVTPIMLSLSAAAPIFRGYLADVDCRWDVISGSVDDRTPEERSLLPLKKDQHAIQKSRYGSISHYLSPGPMYSGGCCSVESLVDLAQNETFTNRKHYFKEEYNDLNAPFDQSILEKLVNGGVDYNLARHYAHLFIRDPLVIFKELLDQDDKSSSDHFENIQSTNWQTMRFKPPPPNLDIGWRVEFRSMEIQLTDNENAAFAIFVVLLTRTILCFDLNFYLPLTKVDENMKIAQKRGSVLLDTFWFRTNIVGNFDKINSIKNGRKFWHEKVKGDEPFTEFQYSKNNSCGAYELMTINEIINGKPSSNYPGLVPMIEAYLGLSHSELNDEEFEKLIQYLYIIRDKANGKLQTAASWIRKYVMAHKDYKNDSVVSESITFDLCNAVKDLRGTDYLK